MNAKVIPITAAAELPRSRMISHLTRALDNNADALDVAATSLALLLGEAQVAWLREIAANSRVIAANGRELIA